MIRTSSTLRSVDLRLMALALVIAMALKFAVHETEQLTERVVEAQVNYTPPGPDLVSYNRVDKVRVTVRGKASDMSRLSQFNVEVTANLPNAKPGPNNIVFDDKDVRFNAQGDFEVLSIDPNRFTIQVERRVRNIVPVHVQLTGEPSAGASVGTPTPRPAQAQISGPESKVAAITRLVAEISLEGHARTFVEDVTLRTQDPLVQVVQPNTVRVEVPMKEPELSIRIDDIDSQQPAGQTTGPDQGPPSTTDPAAQGRESGQPDAEAERPAGGSEGHR